MIFCVGLVFLVGLLVFLVGVLIFCIGLVILIGLLVFCVGLAFVVGLLFFLVGLLVFLVGVLIFCVGLVVLFFLVGLFQVVMPSVFQCLLTRFCLFVQLVCHCGVLLLLLGGRPGPPVLWCGSWEPGVVTRISFGAVCDVALCLSKRPSNRSRTAESFCSS